MKHYLYPHNLKATASLWLWGLRDFTILAVAALFAVILFVRSGSVLPAVLTIVFGILSIRTDDITLLDYLRNAVRFFLSNQQYLWRLEL